MRVLRALATIAALLLQVSAAFGHASLVSSEPADGAVLAAAPSRIVLTFNEPVSLISAQVLDTEGRNVVAPDAATVGNAALEIALPASLKAGSYVASYRIVSLDGHPVAGSVVFSVGEVAAADLRALRAVSGEGIGRLAWTAVRASLNVALLGAAGGVLFMVLVARGGPAAEITAMITSRLAMLGLAAAALSIGVQGGMLAGGPLQGILSTEIWRMGLTSTFGRSGLVAILGLGLIVAGLHLTSAACRFLTLTGSVVALASFAFAGHVVTAGPRWLTLPALLLHTSAVAFWVGSLLPLRAALGEPDATAIVRRFSTIAVIAVAILVGAGVVIAVLQVRGFAALVTTVYGWALLAKLGLVACLLSIAAINKLRLTPRLTAGDASARRVMRATIAAECGLALVILTVTALLGTTPPPRAFQASDDAASIAFTLTGKTLHADVTLSPARVGPVDLHVRLGKIDGAPLTPMDVDVSLSRPDVGVEPIGREAKLSPDGTWSVEGLPMPLAGEWSLRVQVLVSDFEREILEGTFAIGVSDAERIEDHHRDHGDADAGH